MTKYLNGRFSVAAPSNDNYQKNYEDIFGIRKRDGDCTRCAGRGQIDNVTMPGMQECPTCEGTGRAAYASKFDTSDDVS